jgi:hypothetical protein
MSDYFVTYDLEETRPDPHSAFLDEAEAVGWSRWIWGTKNNKWLRLPNTSLVGDFPTQAAAKKAFDDAVAATALKIGRSVDVEKFLLAAYSSATFNSDEKADPTG